MNYTLFIQSYTLCIYCTLQGTNAYHCSVEPSGVCILDLYDLLSYSFSKFKVHY